MKNHLVFQRKETPRQGAKLKLRGPRGGGGGGGFFKKKFDIF